MAYDPTAMTDEEAERVVQLLSQGLTHRQIAREFGDRSGSASAAWAIVEKAIQLLEEGGDG